MHFAGCQRGALVGAHPVTRRAWGRITRGLGVRSGLRRLVDGKPRPTVGLGSASRFAPGEWVRVRDARSIRGTLDGRARLRGLEFVPAQWRTCDRVYRVAAPVRRMLDDTGRPRAIAGTVRLDGVTCDVGGPELGCGRGCPLFFRDEWLEPATAPGDEAQGEPRDMRVRAAAAILATLDGRGARDGVPLLPQMLRRAGQPVRVLRAVERVFELDRWVAPRGPIYLLDGVYCDGSDLGARGPCDRACALLWHGDWLEPATPSP